MKLQFIFWLLEAILEQGVREMSEKRLLNYQLQQEA